MFEAARGAYGGFESQNILCIAVARAYVAW